MRTHLLLPVLAVALAGSLAGCASTDPAVVEAAQPGLSPTPAAASPSDSAPTAPSVVAATTAATPAASGTRAVVVYYVNAEAALVREVHRRPATSGVVRDAVEAVLRQAPFDADYVSSWPRAARVLGVRVEGRRAVVDFSREVQRTGLGSGFESAAFQQLVWTVTTAAPSVREVRLLVEGATWEDGWGHVDTSRPLTRQEASSILAPVQVLTPRDGSVLARGARFGGEATVFEATVSWELRRGATVVRKGFATASTGAPERGTWSATMPAVAPGDYVLRAFESSAEDGRQMFVDDKRVRVS